MLSHAVGIAGSIVAVFYMTDEPEDGRKTIDLGNPVGGLYDRINRSSDGLEFGMLLDANSLGVFQVMLFE
jgi:hypothetical protein